MNVSFPIDINQVKGFLSPAEGETLAWAARVACQQHPALEVGSYCGKSTLYLAHGCRVNNSVVFAVDHHEGSEEHQPGEQYHDAALFDQQYQRMDSFREFKANISKAGYNDTVVPIVAPSTLAAKHWRTPLGLVFIDGGHSEEAASNDFDNWAKHLVEGGLLLIHDLFPDPKDGGQAPINLWRRALATNLYKKVTISETLGVLVRTNT